MDTKHNMKTRSYGTWRWKDYWAGKPIQDGMTWLQVFLVQSIVEDVEWNHIYTEKCCGLLMLYEGLKMKFMELYIQYISQEIILQEI